MRHVLLAALVNFLPAQQATDVERPNVLFITLDDCGLDFGCYGNELVETPNLDALAAAGLRFTNCFTATPVCSPSRSALLTGRYPSRIGSHHHRSDRRLPAGVETLPELFRKAGYRATWLPAQKVSPKAFAEGASPDPGKFITVTGKNKLDMNYSRGRERGMFDNWSSDGDEPFFALIDFNSMKTPAPQAQRVAALRGRRVDPASVPLQPYWPDTAAVRAGQAHYHEGIDLLDLEVGKVLEWLDREGLRDRTMIFVWGDHGPAFLRAKQWCYDEGLRVPLLLDGPGIEPAVREELVSSVDLAATALAACGIDVPAGMDGRDLLDEQVLDREVVFAGRDRCDETEDRVRAIRDRRYKLIANLRPELSWVGRNAYTRRSFPSVGALLEMRAGQDELTAVQAALMASEKPRWELYDTQQDPLELHNLSGQAEYAEVEAGLRKRLEAWVAEVDRDNPWQEPLRNVVPALARERVSRQRYIDGAAEDLPKVLVIGDSISIGYTPFVRELLAGEAVVEHNPGNGGYTGRGLAQLDNWLGDEDWDLITFNWGLHDLAHRPDGSKTRGLDLGGTLCTPLEGYEKNLAELVRRLQATGSRLLWVNTTPVPKGSQGRKPADPARYNEVAAEIMSAAGIETVDLYARSQLRPKLQQRRNVHYSDQGYEHLAGEVARQIRLGLR